MCTKGGSANNGLAEGNIIEKCIMKLALNENYYLNIKIFLHLTNNLIRIILYLCLIQRCLIIIVLSYLFIKFENYVYQLLVLLYS